MKIVSKIMVSLLIMIQITSISNASISYEEENSNDDIIISEERESSDVDNSNLLTDNLRVNAKNAIAIDASTRQVLFEQNSYEVVPMASTTKILTALIAISQGDLDKEITIGKNAVSIRGSKVGYKVGEKIKLRELLFGLMFKSGNDAAIAIAEGLSGSVESFAKTMNYYAVSLGLTTSHFETPHGLDSSKHYSSAYDLAILASKAMESDVFREICGQKTISKDKYNFTREYQNINKILWKIPEANGVKTGYTGQAGKCLVSSVKYEGRNIIIVVLNCSDRWNVTEKIFNYVSANYIFKKDNNKELLKSSSISNLGSIIEEDKFNYGIKEENEIGVEVFSPVDNIIKGDILGKIYLKDKGSEKIKKSLKSNVKISKESFNKLINVEREGLLH